MGSSDFAWADALRREHYPPDRNRIDAHVTLFRHLPPTSLDEVKAMLSRIAAGQKPPPARLGGVMHLGRGVAYRIDSPALLAMRESLAEHFHGLLTPQDQAVPRLHITIQNKADPQVAKALYAQLSQTFESRPLAIQGLAAWYYRGGPWDPIARYPFRGRNSMR